MELAGRVAIVTGAGAGIGRAVALALGGEGAAVVVSDIDEGSGSETVSALEDAANGAAFVRVDAGSDSDLRAAIDYAHDRFGGLDVLVNNAGGVEAPYFPDAPVEQWSRVLDVNLHGVMAATQHAIAAMGPSGGAIVNVSSVAGLGYGPHGAPEYAAAKAAVVRLTAALAPLGERNIRVSCVCPDWVDTPAVRRTLAAMTPDERANAPASLVSPSEIADDVLGLIRADDAVGRVLVHRVDGRTYVLSAERED